jgi:beta-galactosidase GanA
MKPASARRRAERGFAQVSQEIARLDARVDTERFAVALVFDYESAWAWDIQPQGRDFSYLELMLSFYRGLRRAGFSVDIVPPTPEAVAGRKLTLLLVLFAPSICAGLAPRQDRGDRAPGRPKRPLHGSQSKFKRNISESSRREGSGGRRKRRR